jgi:hypothetical protein
LLADDTDTVVVLNPAAIHGKLIEAIEAVQFAEVFLPLARSLIEHIQADQGFIVTVQLTKHFILLAINSTQEN